VDSWLAQARDALAEEAGIEPGELELSEGDTDALLDLARIAAHVSGERTNAPLLCYLVGRAQAQSPRTVEQLAQAVRSTS
jgi:hypothetical protein